VPIERVSLLSRGAGKRKRKTLDDRVLQHPRSQVFEETTLPQGSIMGANMTQLGVHLYEN
jgi:hypothetical protein